MKSQRYREESDTHLLVYNRLHFDLVIADISDSIVCTVSHMLYYITHSIVCIVSHILYYYIILLTL